MDLVLERKQHVFRLPTYLLLRLKELAKADRRSLNNYVEGLLMDAVYRIPNQETIDAMQEAESGQTEGPIDTSSVEAMLKSMGL